MRATRDKIKVGMRVKRPHDMSAGGEIEGVVGEVDSSFFYIWQNTYRGSTGRISPASMGFKYSWAISWGNEIEILGGGENMKRIFEILVIDKSKNEILVREIIIDGDEKSACSKLSISFADKLKGLVFDNLHYIAKELGSYEEKKK